MSKIFLVRRKRRSRFDANGVVVAVGFNITKADVARPTQIFARKPGRYLFRGLWHGDRNPHDHLCYGKVEGQVGIPIGKVVGKRLSPFLIKKMR